MDLSLSNDIIPRKLKHTSPIKPIKLSEKSVKKSPNEYDDIDQSFNQIVIPDEKELLKKSN